MYQCFSAEGYRIHSLQIGPMDTLVYLIEDHETRRTAVVDPAWNVHAILKLKLADEQSLRLECVLLTHGHDDHANGLPELLDHEDLIVHFATRPLFGWPGLTGSRSAAPR